MKKIFILLIVLFTIFILFNQFNSFLVWDENAYLANARSIVSSSNFTEDFRFPLLEYLISLVWLITKESVLAARLMIIAFSLALVYVFYLISKEYFGEKSALFLSAIFSSNFLFLHWGFRVYTEIPSLFFMTLAFYLILISENKKVIIFSGILSGLAFLTKFNLGLFIASAAIYFLIKKEYKKLLIYSMGVLIVVSPWLIYNHVNYNYLLWDFKEQAKLAYSYTTYQNPIRQFFNLFIMGPLALFLPLGIYNFYKKRLRKDHYQLMIIYLSLFVIYFFFLINLKLSRYYLAALPFLYILGYKGFTDFQKKYKNIILKKGIFISIVLFALASLAITFAIVIQHGNCSKDGAIEKTIDFLDSDASPNDHIISNFWPWIGYNNNLKVNFMWSDNVKKLIDIHTSKYFAIINKDGVEVDKNVLDESDFVRLEKQIKGNCGQEVSIYKVI